MQSINLKLSALQRLHIDQWAPEPGVGMTVHEAMQKICVNVINAALIRRQLATGVFDLERIDSLLAQIIDSSYKASDILSHIHVAPLQPDDRHHTGSVVSLNGAVAHSM